MFCQKTMDVDVTALYAPSMAQIGLPSASMPPDYWGSDRTSRCSKALHSHKSKYNLCDLPMLVLKTLFWPQYHEMLRSTFRQKLDPSFSSSIAPWYFSATALMLESPVPILAEASAGQLLRNSSI